MTPGLFDDQGPPERVCPDCHAEGYDRGHPGCSFPVGGETLARSDGPLTSRIAAADLRGSTILGRLQAETLRIVRDHPGLTAGELGRLWPDDSERTMNPLPRRLSELARAGKLRIGPAKPNPLTGRLGVTWFVA